MSTAFKILEGTYPNGILFTPSHAKLGPDEQKEVQVKYKFNSVKNEKGEFSIQLRNGKVMKVPFQIKCFLPKIDISCKLFDFGNVAVDIESE